MSADDLIGLYEIEKARTFETLHFGLASTVHRDTQGQPLDFEQHKPLIDILKDTHHLIACQKAVQIGFTGTVLEPLLFASMMDGQRVFYVLPDGTLRDNFVHDRVDPLLGSIPAYRTLVHEAEQRLFIGRTAADAVSMKQLGKSTVFFIVSNASSSFRMHAADRGIVDEYDDCHQVNVGKVDGRLTHSKLKHRFDVGNPSLAGYGVNALWEDSDQRRWFTDCPQCGQSQTMDWFKNVVTEVEEGVWMLLATADRTDDAEVRKNPKFGAEPDIFCVQCSRPLNRFADGRWVVGNPGVDRHGYQISQLECGIVSIRDMWAQFVSAQGDLSKLQVFHNEALGQTFESTGTKLSRPLLQRVVGDYGRKSTCDQAFMGVDVGNDLHICIMDEDRQIIELISMPNKKAVDRIGELIHQYNAYVAIDIGPERAMSMELVEAFPGAVYRVEFQRAERPGEPWELRDADNLIKADRTQFMDATHGRILRGEIKLFEGALSVPDFVDHMIAPTRIFEPAKPGSATRGRYVWSEGSKKDHYRFAVGYADLIAEVFEEIGTPQIGIL